MIGQFTVGGTTAVLSNRGVWSCPDEILAGHLNRSFNPADDGPSGGAKGRGAVARAAARFGGVAWFPPATAREPDEFGPDVVY